MRIQLANDFKHIFFHNLEVVAFNHGSDSLAYNYLIFCRFRSIVPYIVNQKGFHFGFLLRKILELHFVTTVYNPAKNILVLQFCGTILLDGIVKLSHHFHNDRFQS